MIIDNGAKAHLVIDGVFDGLAGASRGELAFVPNRSTRKPEFAKTGELDGQPVHFTVARQGGMFVATLAGAA